jgi:sugar lactone lactonase YvrE
VSARPSIALVFALVAGSGCFDGAVPPGVSVACRTKADCPADRRACVAERCVDAVPACVVLEDDGSTRPQPDGVACGEGLVCRGGACVAPVCGDGVFDDVAEGCDDGNDNPFDGCDRCQRRGWQHEVVVGAGVRDAAAADVGFAQGLFVDRLDDKERVLIAVPFRNRVLRLDADGSISVVAGNGGADGYDGDGGPATQAAMFWPWAAVFDAFGRVLVADHLNNRLRRVDGDGIISTVASFGSVRGFGPLALARGPRGEILFTVVTGGELRRLNADDSTTVLVQGLGSPRGLAVGDDGVVFVTEVDTHRVLRLNTDGTLTTIAGTGSAGFGDDGIPATSSALNVPSALAFDDAGNLYVAEQGSHRVRRIDPEGIIGTVAGTGEPRLRSRRRPGRSTSPTPATSACCASTTNAASTSSLVTARCPRPARAGPRGSSPSTLRAGSASTASATSG